MSDPMTNTEVEDVLSSIRRLVSNEKRLGTTPKPEASSDRLVLTPSLRVLDDEEAESEDTAETAAEWLDMPQAFDDVDSNYDDAEVTGENSLALDADLVQEDALDNFTEDAAQDDFEFDDPQESMAQDLAATGDTCEDDWPDHPNEGAEAAPEGDNLDVDGHQDHGDHDTGQFEEPDEAPVGEGSASGVSSATESLSEKIAALETLIAGRADQWEPDGVGTDAYAGTEQPAMEWEDAEADGFDAEDQTASFAPQGARTATAPEPDAPFMSNDEDVLDEAALRELVSDIVREELQGALGERITRNVRKLVRREIHRALAAQDLE